MEISCPALYYFYDIVEAQFVTAGLLDLLRLLSL